MYIPKYHCPLGERLLCLPVCPEMKGFHSQQNFETSFLPDYYLIYMENLLYLDHSLPLRSKICLLLYQSHMFYLNTGIPQ